MTVTPRRILAGKVGRGEGDSFERKTEQLHQSQRREKQAQQAEQASPGHRALRLQPAGSALATGRMPQNIRKLSAPGQQRGCVSGFVHAENPVRSKLDGKRKR